MAVLRRRLHTPAAPPEPWSNVPLGTLPSTHPPTCRSAAETRCRDQLQATWYFKRKWWCAAARPLIRRR